MAKNKIELAKNKLWLISLVDTIVIFTIGFVLVALIDFEATLSENLGLLGIAAIVLVFFLFVFIMIAGGISLIITLLYKGERYISGIVITSILAVIAFLNSAYEIHSFLIPHFIVGAIGVFIRSRQKSPSDSFETTTNINEKISD